MIQKLGIHPRHLRPIAGRHGLPARRHQLRRQQDLFRRHRRHRRHGRRLRHRRHRRHRLWRLGNGGFNRLSFDGRDARVRHVRFVERQLRGGPLKAWHLGLDLLDRFGRARIGGCGRNTLPGRRRHFGQGGQNLGRKFWKVGQVIWNFGCGRGHVGRGCRWLRHGGRPLHRRLQDLGNHRRRLIGRGNRLRQSLDTLDRCARRRQSPARSNRFTHARELINARLQNVERCRRRRDSALIDLQDEALELVAQVAHRLNAGHAGAALQSVQRTLQRPAQLGAVRIRAPSGDRGLGAIEKLDCLLGEDARDLGIKLRDCVGGGLRLLRRMGCVRRIGGPLFLGPL